MDEGGSESRAVSSQLNDGQGPRQNIAGQANLAVDAEFVQMNGKFLLRVEAHAALAAL